MFTHVTPQFMSGGNAMTIDVDDGWTVDIRSHAVYGGSGCPLSTPTLKWGTWGVGIQYSTLTASQV